MNFFHTHISPNAIGLVIETLRSTHVSEGKRVHQFEEELTNTLRLIHPVAVNSGTSALHLALAVADVGAGDEVILPAQTFVASGLSILMCGATPVFADIQPLTGNIDPDSIAAKVTPRTKAIMAVHWGGCPCNVDEINDIARDHDLAVIEDAAHALGAIYKGNPVGTLSRFTAFSFQAIKHLTTGDGGALCCLDEKDFHEARCRRWFGIDRDRHRPSIIGERVYNLEQLGFKYHLNDLSAAVGLGNLSDIRNNLARHRQIAQAYREQLSNVPGVTLLQYPSDRESSWWIFTILVDRREDFIRALASRGIPSSVVHQRIDRNKVFGGCRDDLAGQKFFDERQVSLPVHVGLSDDDADNVVKSVRMGW
jgi:perosamine synthetase